MSALPDVAAILQDIAALASPLARVERLAALLEQLERDHGGRQCGPVWLRLFTDSVALNDSDL